MKNKKIKIAVNKQFVVIFVGLTAALAGLLFGLDVGVISGALPFISEAWGISTSSKEFIVSSLLIGAFAGSLIAGFVSNKWGRKKAMLVSAIVFATGAFLSSFSSNPLLLEISRFYLGIGVGTASFTAPLYLSEMAPEKIRGALISIYQLMITVGIVVAFSSDTLLSYGGHWRMMLGIVAIPAVVMFIGISFLPRSPRWLLLVKKKDEAKKVLTKLRESEEEIESEINDIESSLNNKQKGFSFLLKNPNYRKVLFLGIGLQAAQQFTGMNVIMYYAPKIFQLAGFTSGTQAMWGTVIVGLTNVLATFIAIAFVDKIGRKPILFIGYSVMGISMLILGLMFHIGIKSEMIQYTAIAVLLTFIIGFAMSAGPIIWVLCSEIFPLQGRDLGITISTATNWLCNAIVGLTFLSLLNGFGVDKTFWLYGFINLTFILVLIFFVPETKGVTLENIEKNLMSGVKLKEIGR